MFLQALIILPFIYFQLYNITTMFNAKVYKIAVISLSGVMEETYAAKETVQKWNQENAENTGKLFLLVDEPMKSR